MSEHAAVENNTLHSALIQESEHRYVLRLTQSRLYLTVNTPSARVDSIASNGIIDST